LFLDRQRGAFHCIGTRRREQTKSDFGVSMWSMQQELAETTETDSVISVAFCSCWLADTAAAVLPTFFSRT
jgi:hypothetical protein